MAQRTFFISPATEKVTARFRFVPRLVVKLATELAKVLVLDSSGC